MFIALDKNKERVSIDNADKTKQYFCPVCGESLSIKATDSLSVKPHYAHKRGTECLDDWKHDMSEWHYGWQRIFPEEYREVVVEKDGKKHRADVLINGFVIEFQHSPITAEEIIARNEFYLNCGYKVIWVFDANGKIKNIYDSKGSIDPFKSELEWKRSRREFNIPTPNGVFIFAEYNAKICTNPPRTADIMIYLTKFHHKKIEHYNTCPIYMQRANLIRTIGISLSAPSIPEMLEEHEKFKKAQIRTGKHYIPRGLYRRKFRL